MTQTDMPFSPEAEEGVIGMLLWHPETFPIVSSHMNPRDIRSDELRKFYIAIQIITTRGGASDMVTVNEELKHSGVIDANDTSTFSYLCELQSREAALFNPSTEAHRAADYAQLIADKAERRRLIYRTGDIIAIAENGSKAPTRDAIALLQEELAKTKANEQQEQASKEELSLDTSRSIQSTMPALTGEAAIPDSGMLPNITADPSTWFEQWDSSGLREVSHWLAEYIAYSHKVSPEGHPDFHIAGALWTLSTVGGRRIYAPLTDPMYTPLAIALVARTSLFAKSTTAKAAINILRASRLNWLLGDDETTPQKLLQDMACHVPSNYSEMDFDQQLALQNRLGMSGQVGWYYDEFNQLIDAMKRPGPMADFAGLIRKLDNCQDEYTYSTKSGGREVIEKPYLALLASTTPANLRKHASKGSEFWNDGFWARFIFITPPQDAWFTKTMEIGIAPIPHTLTDALKDWNGRLGVPNCHVEEIIGENEKRTGKYKAVRSELADHAVTIEPEAYRAYVRYREALRRMIAENGNQDLDGSYVRIADKALRVATLLGSLENNNRIDFSIWALAQEIAEMFRYNLHEMYNQVTTAQQESPLEDVLIDFLKKQPDRFYTAREIYQNVRKLQPLGTAGIRGLLVNLEKSGVVTCREDGKKECYSLSK